MNEMGDDSEAVERELFIQAFGGQRVLVTGGLGFVGSHLVRQLLRVGAHVAVLDNGPRPTRPSPLSGADGDAAGRLRVLAGDVRCADDIAAAVGDRPLRAVFHLAAFSVIERAAENPIAALNTNTLGTANLLEVVRSRSTPPEAVVIASTDKVYGEMEGDRYTERSALRGIGLYDAAKLAGDVMAQAYAQAFDIGTVVLRLCNVFGPYDPNHRYRLVPRSLSFIFNPAGPRPPELYYDSLGHWRDYIYIADAVRALLLAACTPSCRGDVFNVPGCAHLSTPDVLARLITVATAHERTLDPQRAETIHNNGFRVAVTARPVGVTNISRQHLDGSKFAARAGFAPRTAFDDGLVAAVAQARRWYLAPTGASARTA